MAGNLRKRGKESWELSFSHGYDANGKRIRHYKTIKAKSEREAQKELAKFVTEIEKGSYVVPSKLTFGEFSDKWIEMHGTQNLAPKTLDLYIGLLNDRIIPALGHLKLEQIKPMHLVEFYKNLKETGIRLDGKPGPLSDQYIVHHHRLIRTMLQYAVKWQFLSSNPASQVDPPKVRKKQTNVYDEKQVQALLEAVENEDLKYKVLIHLAVSTGMRQGELLGLEWKHIDLENFIIHVCQSSQYIPGKGVFTKSPKNETSVRSITVPVSIIALLKQYRVKQKKERLRIGDKWHESDRLFTTWDGKAMHPTTVSSWFPEFLRKYELPRIRFHALRHTAATLLINQNVHMKTISARLGHSNIQTTMDIYGHSLKSADQDAADKLDFLFKSETKRKGIDL
ncbi:site-specific integrase [Neobacillus cucumis]|uniref:tyrosine-type recombinase/integrase n=1 Tax=Neobacillus cucumis TaxID=1740721 RepID=UPI0018DF4E5B|nr:site-specific integrase [Neobacillus cucumis]MBI0578613.1 site-specific integrase [Neobacillus cucumis]